MLPVLAVCQVDVRETMTGGWGRQLCGYGHHYSNATAAYGGGGGDSSTSQYLIRPMYFFNAAFTQPRFG